MIGDIVKKDESIIDLFERKPKFMEYSIYFYQKERSKTEVEELCEDVTYQTMDNHFQAFKDENGRYKEGDLIQSSPGGRDLPQKFTNKVPAIWMMYRAKLSEKEGDLLFKFFETSAIDNILRKSESWDEFSKVVVISMIFMNIFKRTELDFENPVAFLQFLELDMFERVSEEEVGDFAGALQEWAEENGKETDRLIEKILDSDIPIIINAHEWESMISRIIISTGQIPLKIIQYIASYPRLKKDARKEILRGLRQIMKQGIPKEFWEDFLEEN